jgi:hypothetical protein
MVIVVPILFIVMVVSTFRLSRRIWDVVDTPTVSPSGALIGRCEVSGKAALFKPDHDFRTTVTSPISRVDCVWFDVIVEEYVQQGKSSYWRGIARHRYENGFDIYDEHGSILVEVPDSGYEFQSRYRHDENEMVRLAAFNHFHPGEKSKSEGWTPSPDGYFMWHDNLNRWIPTQYVSADGEQYYDDSTGAWTPVSKPSFLSSVADFVGDSLSGHWDKRRVRVSEYVVYPDEEIFVHGIVGVRDNSSQLKIGHGDSRDPMRVSCKGEESVLSRLKRFRIAAWLGALGLGIGTIFIGDDTFATYFGIDINVVSVFIVAGIAFVVMWIFLVFFRAYNRFIRLRQQVAMSNSTIGICEKTAVRTHPAALRCD